MKKIFFAVALMVIGLTSCKKNDATINGTGTLKLHFENVVNGEDLVLNTQTYHNAANEAFNISAFKYYVTNIELTKADGSVYKAPDSYLLVDQSVESSLKPTLEQVPAGDYTKISFTIGVDSASNFKEAQTGALDPANGMFWDSKEGYIFVKLAGSSPDSKAADNKLQFDIGGASAAVNAIRKVAFNITPSAVRVRTDKAPSIHFKVNAAKMFSGSQDISFAAFSHVVGGADALIIADNYAAGMFSYEHIHN